MKFDKQSLFDLGIVLALPIVIGIGYYFWGRGDDSALLSLTGPGQSQEYGVKARQALASLKSINMDDSLFSDPVYQSLNEFYVELPTGTQFGRTYPFTRPPAVEAVKPRTSAP